MNGMCTSTHPEDPEIHCDLPDIHDGAHVSLPNHWWSREPEAMTDLRQAMLALAESIDHTDHEQDEEGVDRCRDCSRWPAYRTMWPCVHHKHAEKIRAAVQEPDRRYPCPWIVMARPDHPDGETWGDDKIKCSKARGHTGKHITADGYEFGS